MIPEFTFDPAGPALSAEIRAGFAQPGSYTLLLWAANTNAVVGEWKGNFLNPDDDAYFLPGGVANDGRIVEAIVTLQLVDPPQYSAELVIQQGEEVLGTVRFPRDEQAATGEAFDNVTLDLFCRVRAS